MVWIADLLMADGHHIRAAVMNPSHHDRHDVAAMTARDPTLADGVRDVKSAMHHDIGDGVEAARAQILRARDEITGRIVDQVGQRTGCENVRHHRIDRRRIADINAIARHLAAMLRHQFGSGFITHAFAAAADEELGAERQEFLRHALAQSGAAASHQNAPAAQQSVLEHPCPSRFFVRVGSLLTRQRLTAFHHVRQHRQRAERSAMRLHVARGAAIGQ
jgi:hypothetical protein